MSIVRRVLWWLIPIVFLFCLHAEGLQTWFIADDFAWLGLIHTVHNSRELLTALFAPAAQGTIRPWSERGFFLLFESLFGLDSLPFRICVFVTMAANVALIAWITRRITGSSAAGFLAAILWTVNTNLVTVMEWSSAYNEALCPFFLLVAMVLFIRYAESGCRVFWWWQLVVFSLGLGALEINVIYPALAASYALCVAEAGKRKKLLLSLTPLFCISVAYFLMHRALAPLPRDGPYAVYVDGRILQTLAVYWQWSLLPRTWRELGHSAVSEAAIFWILTVALSAFLIRQITKSRYSVLFFVSWFLMALAPVLPLPNHRTDYYLTIPLIGLAMLGGFGLSQAMGSTWFCRICALIPLAAYLSGMLPVTRIASRWWLDRSLQVRGLVLGVEAAQKNHPGKTIVLDGISSDLYDISIGDSALSSVGLEEAYLTPASGDTIHPTSDFGKLAHIVIDNATLRNAITHDQVVIYSDVGDHLRNITGVWERLNSARLSPNQKLDPVTRRVEVGNPLLAYLLGPEWHAVESPGFRWMPRRATVRLGGPVSTKDKLLLEGYCPDGQLKAGAVHLSVSVDGIPLADTQIGVPESNFRRLFVVPPSLVGRESVEIAISVDHVRHEPGGRELGLVFGTIAFE